MKLPIFAACLLALTAAGTPPAPAQSCAQPNKPAGILEVPRIDVPSLGHSPAHGTVVLRVDISAKGELVGHEYVERTGNPNLDMAALHAAQRVKYTPEIINCRPTAGSYLFVVVFPQE